MSEQIDDQKQYDGIIDDGYAPISPAMSWVYTSIVVFFLGMSVGFMINADQNAHPPQDEQKVQKDTTSK